MSEHINGGQALIRALERQGVEVIFGLPGGAILPVYDPLIDSPIRHILVRHEQGAGHMAEGYAHATGRPGVAMVTSGPAATNIVTPAVRRLHGLGADGLHHRPGRHGVDRHRRLPGVRHRRHHPLGHQAQRAGDRGGGHPDGHPPGVLHRDHGPARPGAGRHPQGHRRPEEPPLGHGVVLADRRRGGRLAARLQAHHPGPPPQDPRGGRADHPLPPAGDLRRWRHPQGPRRRGPAGAGRAVRHPRRHHAHGPGRLPRRAPPVPGHARHARQLHRGHRHAGVRPAHRARQPLRRPHHRARAELRPPRQDHPRRHRPGRARQGPPARRAHRRRLPAGDRGARQGGAGPGRRRGAGRPLRLALPDQRLAGALPAHLRPGRPGRRATSSPST